MLASVSGQYNVHQFSHSLMQVLRSQRTPGLWWRLNGDAVFNVNCLLRGKPATPRQTGWFHDGTTGIAMQ